MTYEDVTPRPRVQISFFGPGLNLWSRIVRDGKKDSIFELLQGIKTLNKILCFSISYKIQYLGITIAEDIREDFAFEGGKSAGPRFLG